MNLPVIVCKSLCPTVVLFCKGNDNISLMKINCVFEHFIAISVIFRSLQRYKQAIHLSIEYRARISWTGQETVFRTRFLILAQNNSVICFATFSLCCSFCFFLRSNLSLPFCHSSVYHWRYHSPKMTQEKRKKRRRRKPIKWTLFTLWTTVGVRICQ